MLKSAFVFCIAVLGITALASEAYRSDGADIQINQIITGKTVFEKRTTVVPMTLCPGEPCRKPEIYWSLVIYNEETRYEVNQIYGIGSRIPPTKVEVAGSEIREGEIVEIEGRVNPISRAYAIVTEISRAAILENPEEMEMTSNLMSDAYSWMCQSPTGDTHRIYASVRYMHERDSSSGTEPRYYMAISMARGSDELSYLPIAEIENVKSSFDETRIVFTGGDDHRKVELTIDKSSDRMFELPSKLTLSKSRRALGEELQSYPLNCTRTRM